MIKLLGFNSNVGKSGKDTLCELLDAAGFQVDRFAFGDVLKVELSKLLSDILPFTYSYCMTMFHSQDLKDLKIPALSIQTFMDYCKVETDKVFLEYVAMLVGLGLDPNEPRSPREHLQWYGTEFRRKQNENYWVSKVAGLATDSLHRGNLVVVTDVRMINEMDCIEEKGGLMVRVKRDWLIPELDMKPKHESDTQLDYFSMPTVINRWGLKDHLLTQLIDVVKPYGGLYGGTK